MSFPFFPRGLFNQKNGFISENAAPPCSNTGGTYSNSKNSESLVLVSLEKEKFAVPSSFIHSGASSDNLQLVSGRDSAFIDTFSFTFKSTAFYKAFPKSCAVSDCGDDYVSAVSCMLTEILGYGVTSKNKHGRNFYKDSYELGANFGFLAVGGSNQKDSLQVFINAQGLLVAKEGWQKRLYDFGVAVDANITRSDVARDCFNGEYTVDKAYSDHLEGKYKDKYSPKNPTGSKAGCWDFEALGLENQGRTYYIGDRDSSKYLRVYEKGLQVINKAKNKALDGFEKWVRIELELKGKDRKIPWDILLNPEIYLAGAYQALDFISEVQERIKIIKKTFKASVAKMKQNIKNQFGKHLNVLRDIYGVDKEGNIDDSKVAALFSELIKDGYPASLPHFDLSRCPENMDFSENADSVIAKSF